MQDFFLRYVDAYKNSQGQWKNFCNVNTHEKITIICMEIKGLNSKEPSCLALNTNLIYNFVLAKTSLISSTYICMHTLSNLRKKQALYINIKDTK